jgi:hypothetical protein
MAHRTVGGGLVGKITRQRRASRYRAKSRLAEMTDTLFYDIDWLLQHLLIYVIQHQNPLPLGLNPVAYILSSKSFNKSCSDHKASLNVSLGDLIG